MDTAPSSDTFVSWSKMRSLADDTIIISQQKSKVNRYSHKIASRLHGSLFVSSAEGLGLAGLDAAGHVGVRLNSVR